MVWFSVMIVKSVLLSIGVETMEEIWNFGYRCEVGIGAVTGELYGVVSVPKWHPIRSGGAYSFTGCRIPAADILLIRGEWIIYTDFAEDHIMAWTDVMCIAARLRKMQDEWDTLSPYEREYLIW